MTTTYKLKAIARRGTALGAAVALMVGAIIPAVMPTMSAYADALNPLTNRSLTLSSSAPGWDSTDGSGNSTYAQPNSGANGQKTGNTFDFKVSTDTSTGTDKIKTLSFQYCTKSAGQCTSPGDDGFDTSGGAGNYTRKADDSTHSDLNVVTSSPAEVGSSDFSTVVDSSGVVQAVPGFTNPNDTSDTTGEYAAKDVAGNFVVYYKLAGTWTQSTGWNMYAVNVEDGTVGAGTGTGKNNYIILSNSTGLGVATGTEVKVVFFGTSSNYITNPGSGYFFVKINTYKVAYDGTGVTTTDLEPTTDGNVIDGGVTVANVMNQSIEIQTKVLETMDFSVGTVDPDTLDDTQLSTATAGVKTVHGQCDSILTAMAPGDAENVLHLGDQTAESSLSTTETYATHSYLRLSSNSSAGATIYYAGETLSNTEGDQIQAIGTTSSLPTRGSPQFGLAIDNATTGNRAPDYTTEEAPDQSPTTPVHGVFESAADDAANGLSNPLSGSIDASVATDIASQSLTGYHDPQLAPLTPMTAYADGSGVVNTEYGTVNAKFAFDPNANSIPAAIASENSQVVDCVTAKIRYIANIAATTPAGIYTTKVNYIAAPQY